MKNNPEITSRQVDEWFDNIQPIPPQSAPDGFAAKVMQEIERRKKSEVSAFNNIRFWRNMAAGLALLLGVNLFTMLNTQRQMQSEDALTGEIILEYQSMEPGIFAGFYSSTADNYQ